MGSITETTSIERALLDRGVDPRLAAWFPVCLNPDVIARTLAWYDAPEQRGRVGAGVLVAELRKGGRPATETNLLERQGAYLDAVVEWLRQHFPQWNREEGNRTHTAAVACVIRLHHRHGKNGLSVKEHGPEIREAVRRFDRELAAVDGSAGEGEE